MNAPAKSRHKGIILAGGAGTRLLPLTRATSKQLMPVYDKPMIYYPLTTLMFAGIRDILVITTPRDQAAFEALLGDGSQWGLSLNFTVQERPGGTAEAILLGEEFIGDDPVALILGDNIFYSEGLMDKLAEVGAREEGATIFGYYVKDPEKYGVVCFDDEGHVTDIEEKPAEPRSHYAVTGLYFFDRQVVEIAKKIPLSVRGELEITDVNRTYLEQRQLRVELLGRGTAWLDTGTHRSLLDAGRFMQVVEERQGLKIACPEEVAYRMGLIDRQQMQALAEDYGPSEYADYLLQVVREIPIER